MERNGNSSFSSLPAPQTTFSALAVALKNKRERDGWDGEEKISGDKVHWLHTFHLVVVVFFFFFLYLTSHLSSSLRTLNLTQLQKALYFHKGNLKLGPNTRNPSLASPMHCTALPQGRKPTDPPADEPI